MEVVVGFLIAVITVVTGVGTGTITAPLLILLLHVPVPVAVGTALAYTAVVKVIAVPVQMWRKQVVYRMVGYMLLGGLPGVILGSLLLQRMALHGNRGILYAILGAIVASTSLWHLYRHFHPSPANRPPRHYPRLVSALMVPIGIEVGFSASGAGALGTVTLLGLTSLTPVQVVGTDLTFGLCIALAGSAMHLTTGGYDPSLLLQLAIGGVVGAFVGSGLAPRLPHRQMRFALWAWLLLIGIQLCYRAGHLIPR